MALSLQEMKYIVEALETATEQLTGAFALVSGELDLETEDSALHATWKDHDWHVIVAPKTPRSGASGAKGRRKS